ncbi:alpha/beta hydrolase [Legionella quinlivanii]|uniref:Alpha/beta hydrolase n=1 Tax=Legionella quinlivanii TaxID=45073 RepID=A0A0W0XNM9_9GAMM|nr:alpha/beta hydrolase [Legionella quinlivanii]KTD46100.1 alpha/beta hydrolase [Legionella quinlivanii]SEG28663.1 acetyl esterase [Legionella quinlivanii DSM 21216]STY10597.1 alpha/beta hydrolase [Legionella quinlivanii]
MKPINTDSSNFIKRLGERASSALDGQNLLEMEPGKAREAFNKLVAPVAGRLKAIDVHTEDRELDINGHKIQVRLYKPSKDSSNLPALIYCHGGGFVFGDLDFLDYTCRFLSEAANCLVVAVDYRRAPEHKFPAAHNDCYDVIRYVQKHAAEFGGNGKVAIAGDSAGGNIAASICHQAKKNKDVVISFQLLYYPWVDLNNTMPSDKTYETGYFLETATLHWMRKQYLGKAEDEKSPEANPQFQTDFKNLPPALVIAAECDPIHDDAKRYYEKLVEGGNEAQFIEFGGILHDFCALPSHYEAALLAYSASAHALKKALHN